MEIIASTKYQRISPKKIRELSQTIAGLPPQQAMDRLLLFGNKASRILSIVVKSALSNAKNNFKMDNKLLKIKTVQIGKGPFLKRYQPVSRGMAHQIKKRTSHIKVILEEVNSKSEVRNPKQDKMTETKKDK